MYQTLRWVVRRRFYVSISSLWHVKFIRLGASSGLALSAPGVCVICTWFLVTKCIRFYFFFLLSFSSLNLPQHACIPHKGCCFAGVFVCCQHWFCGNIAPCVYFLLLNLHAILVKPTHRIRSAYFLLMIYFSDPTQPVPPPQNTWSVFS